MYFSCICVEGLPRTAKINNILSLDLNGGPYVYGGGVQNVQLTTFRYVSVSLLAALKSYFNTSIPSCSFMLGIANFYIITISKDVSFPRSPRLQTFDQSACNCESLVGPCCVLHIHTQVHWFCASYFWLPPSTVLELK